MASVISCRWDWCRSSFASIDALDTHVKHDHIWPMQPMRKAEIAFMRRMDRQSLHSSPNTDPSTIPEGPSPSETLSLVPPSISTPKTQFDAFARLSCPSQTHSPQRTSPALEDLLKQGGHAGLSAAIEMFERAHGHKAKHHRSRLPSNQRSPIHRPLSDSSGSSQDVVEQQLTQEDDAAFQPPPPLLSEPQVENELADADLKWPTELELQALAIRNSGQPVSTQSDRPASTPDSARGRNFRCGSLNVPLGVNSQSASPSRASRESNSGTQPIVLQTQAPYSSQSVD